MKRLTFILSLVPLVMSCSHKTVTPDANSGATSRQTSAQENVQAIPIASKPLGMVLKASAFRMSGDYADKVALTIAAQGNITYFPAPSDLSAESAPLSLGDGWWLNRQGISANSVFTKYTFAEYMSLPSSPSPQELKQAVIPGAKVTEMIRLPFPASEASQKMTEIKEYLKNL